MTIRLEYTVNQGIVGTSCLVSVSVAGSFPVLMYGIRPGNSPSAACSSGHLLSSETEEIGCNGDICLWSGFQGIVASYIGVHAGKSGCPSGIAGKILGGWAYVLEVRRQNLSVLVVLCQRFVLAMRSGQ